MSQNPDQDRDQDQVEKPRNITIQREFDAGASDSADGCQDTSKRITGAEMKNTGKALPMATQAVVSMLSAVTISPSGKVVFPSTKSDKLICLGTVYDSARSAEVEKPQDGKKKKTAKQIVDENNASLVAKEIKEIDRLLDPKGENWNFKTIPKFRHDSLEIRGHFLLRALGFAIEKIMPDLEKECAKLRTAIDTFKDRRSKTPTLSDAITLHKDFSDFLKELPYGERLQHDIACAITRNAPSLTEQCFELIVATQKFRDHITSTVDFSDFLKKELETSLGILKCLVQFKPVKILTNFPRLTVYSNLDGILPSSLGLSPFNHQVDLCQMIVDNFNSPFLGRIDSMAGSGKTMSIVPVAKIVTKLNDLPENVSCPTVIVFVCNIVPVRFEVAKYLLHAGVLFGIAGCQHADQHKTENRRYFIKKHESCGSQEPDVIVTGPEFALQIIADIEGKGRRVLLFFDEPTVDADKLDSSILSMNASILANLPSSTILSSATLPCDMTRVSTYFREDFSTAKIDLRPFGSVDPNEVSDFKPIGSTDVKIGCDIFTFDQAKVAVFSGAKSRSELARIAKIIRVNPFFKRMCTLGVLRLLDSRITKENILVKQFVKDADGKFVIVNGKKSIELVPVRFDIDKFTSDLSNLTPNAISTCIATLLEDISSVATDDQIENICRLTVNGPDYMMEFSELLDCYTTRLPGMNLIVSPDPLNFIEDEFSGFISEFDQQFNLEREIETFDRKMEIWNRLNEAKERAENSSSKKSRSRGDDGQDGQKADRKATGGNSNDPSDQFDDLDDRKPVFRFPPRFVLNTEENCRHVCAQNEDMCCNHGGHHLQNYPLATDITFDGKTRLADINVDIILKNLLIRGIGVWSKQIKNEHYKNLVLEYVTDGKLAYVVCDETIGYGTNAPVTGILFTDSFLKSHSPETFFQVLSRAGRLGLQFKAHAFIPSSFVERLRAFALTGSDTLFDESLNISETTMVQRHFTAIKRFEDSCYKGMAKEFADSKKILDENQKKLLKEKKKEQKAKSLAVVVSTPTVVVVETQSRGKLDETEDIRSLMGSALPQVATTTKTLWKSARVASTLASAPVACCAATPRSEQAAPAASIHPEAPISWRS
jgi:hypothetical protein